MEVYEPREDSELLEKYVKKLAKGKVLDMGTGSGIQALAAAGKRSVKKVVAIDINQTAVDFVKRKIKEKKLKKMVVKRSDLFSNIQEKFDTIIFNPPYLPQDKGIEDPALYGGKKGWELLEKFLRPANDHLTKDGQILIIFSSITDKPKVDEIIRQNLLDFKELEKKRLPFFEELYAYQIRKSAILKRLEAKGVSKISYLTHGKRGNVFTGFLKNKKVAIKTKRKESRAVARIENEAKWLKILNKKGIGPKLLFSGKDFLVEEFIEGKLFLDWIKKAKRTAVRSIVKLILRQCFELDKLKINKEEMQRPIKHIIIDRQKPILIDFERCYQTKKPHNVTQFGVFLIHLGLADKKKMINLLRLYKQKPSKELLEKIHKLI